MKTLSEVYKKYEGLTDKGNDHNYIITYEKLFERYSGKEVSILEIGIYLGGSMLLWKDFFENSRVVGIDTAIAPETLKMITDFGCESYNVNGSNSQCDIVEGMFDIIIDDASHIPVEQAWIFRQNIKRLKDDGLYIIEDIQNLERDVKIFQNLAVEYNMKMKIVDTRETKGRYDDILIIYTKNGEIDV